MKYFQNLLIAFERIVSYNFLFELYNRYIKNMDGEQQPEAPVPAQEEAQPPAAEAQESPEQPAQEAVPQAEPVAEAPGDVPPEQQQIVQEH